MDHASHPQFAAPIPATQEEFLADRLEFWALFTKIVAISAGAVILLLTAMAIFLV